MTRERLRGGTVGRRTDRDLDLNRVAMFVRIVEAKGVSAAAARAKLPKSSASRALTQLEDELGVELVVRGGRAFQLTDAGRSFYDAAAKGLAAVRDARDELTPGEAEPRGLLRVAAPPGIASGLVTPAIAAFVRRYPAVEVQLSVTAARVDPARDGYDVVFAIGTLDDSSSKARRFGTMDAGVFASEAYLAEHGVPRRPLDLSAHACVIQTRSPPALVWNLRGRTGTTRVPVRGRIHVDDQLSAIAAAAAGGGLVVLPAHAVEREPAARDLRRVLPDWVVPGEPAHILYAASRHVPLRVSAFCDALMEMKSTCDGSTPRHEAR